jgi:hypothetical protein
MPKMSQKLKWVSAIGAAVALMVATIPLAIWVTHTTTAQLENTKRRCEGRQQAVHKFIIEDDRVSPSHVDAVRCDRLVITNVDTHRRLIAFGKHDRHISYNGVSERLLSQNESIELTLGHSGTYLFHDHANEKIRGTFTVKAPLK